MTLELLREIEGGWLPSEQAKAAYALFSPLIDLAEAAEEHRAKFYCLGRVEMMDGSSVPCPVCAALPALKAAMEKLA